MTMELPDGGRRGAVAVGFVVGLFLLPWLVPEYAIFILSTWLVLAIMGMSLDILIGYLGHVSFGHAAFYGLGSYAVILSAQHITPSFLLDFLIACVVVVAVAMVFGVIALRTSRLQFIMITLALAQALWGLAFRWSELTGGDSGLFGLQRPSIPGLDFADPYTFYYFLVVVFCVAALCIWTIVRSPLGLTWHGIKQNESRMSALGYNVWLHKYIAYVVAAFFGGIAGILNAYLTGFVGPDTLFLTTSATAILIVILGGAGTVYGAFFGAGVIVLTRQVVSSYTDRWTLVLGLIYVVVVLLLPRGLAGLPERLTQLRPTRRSGRPSEPKSVAEAGAGNE